MPDNPYLSDIAGGFLAVEQGPPVRHHLQQDVVVLDVPRQDGESELEGLQEQHAVVQRPQLRGTSRSVSSGALASDLTRHHFHEVCSIIGTRGGTDDRRDGEAAGQFAKIK